MAISAIRAAENALSKLSDRGFVVDGEHSQQRDFIETIMEAFYEELTQNGLVVVSGGSSAGDYKVQ